MQWFTEFMELFLSVWELIKTLNLYLPASMSPALRAADGMAQRMCVLHLYCFSRDCAFCTGVPVCLLPAVGCQSQVTRCSHATLGHLVAALLSWLWVSWSPSVQRWRFP